MKTACHNIITVSLWINDRQQDFEGPISIDQLLQRLKISNPAIAVEVNRELVPRADFAETILKNDDRLEIVTLSGGG